LCHWDFFRSFFNGIIGGGLRFEIMVGICRVVCNMLRL